MSKYNFRSILKTHREYTKGQVTAMVSPLDRCLPTVMKIDRFCQMEVGKSFLDTHAGYINDCQRFTNKSHCPTET